MGFDEWQEVSRRGYKKSSKQDDVARISTSIYVTNFPISFTAKDLYHTCKQYGHVVDSFIPVKKAKDGKRFGFVKFINVFNVERLVNNLCTIWIGRLKLHANVARFSRESKKDSNLSEQRTNEMCNSKVQEGNKGVKDSGVGKSYVNVVQGNVLKGDSGNSPAIVLDDDCGNDVDLSRHVFGKVKDFNSINNLKLILAKEGFEEVNLSYMGGLWVMIELHNVESQKDLLSHPGVRSWFQDLVAAYADFFSKERIVWVDVEGIPLNAWSSNTFSRIGNKWGEVMDIEESTGSSFSRKRLCIKTSLPNNILESFKVIFKRKIFMARAKELFTWSPCFSEFKVNDYSSDEEPQVGDNIKPVMQMNVVEEVASDSDEEVVSESLFEAGPTLNCNNNDGDGIVQDEVQKSDDPFGVYDILNKPFVKNVVPDPSLSHPPGFTPVQSSSDSPLVEKSRAREMSPKIQNADSRANVSNVNGLNVSESINEFSSNIPSRKTSKGGSMLDVLDDIIKVGKSLGYVMEGLGHKTKKEWIKELNFKHRSNFLAIQETKMDCISDMDVKFMWGNSNFQYITSDSVGNSGGLLCVWEQSIFKKSGASVSDNFIALYGTWLPTSTKILIIVIYAPQAYTCKRILWEYISSLINRWDGETIVLGDFNAVRTKDERFGSVFNSTCARNFNQFISSSGLIDVKMDGYSFTWSLPSASKMSKLDRFLVSNGILSIFPSISSVCLNRHLSDHRPIILKEISSDYGPTPFRMYHSWFSYEGFDAMVSQAWNSFDYNDSNKLICFKRKLQDLKKIIRAWINNQISLKKGIKTSLLNKLADIDKVLDSGVKSDEILLSRLEVSRRLFNLNQSDFKDAAQQAKVKWAIEGDENSKFFHGVINKKRAQLAVRGVFNNGTWCTDPNLVKESFLSHFASRFKQPVSSRFKLNIPFINRLTTDQSVDLDCAITSDEIKAAVWDCGENKSPGPDGFTFEFFRHFWDLIGLDLCAAVQHFFEKGSFPRGCNSSFIALIPKVPDAKFVSDFRPISLIGSVYKVITKVLANRLGFVISDLVSNTQSAFLKNRQILDGPFILNEIIAWCKRKKKQSLIFKVDFAKAYDSVRWDFLLEVLEAFGFGPRWCSWIRGIFSSNMSSILVNGSPTKEFPISCGLKQGDPLAPLLFILVMESLHLSVSRAVNDGIFKGLQLHDQVTLSHLFYADDVVFVGEWSNLNLANLIKILKCFHLASGLKINIQKSHLMGVGVPEEIVSHGASSIGCAVLHTPFKYLGVVVGDHMIRHSAWSTVIQKVQSRLSRWKANTLSVGGRLTLLKSVLGAVPLFTMSIYKVPMGVLQDLERIRSKFFIGANQSDRKMSWVAWDQVLAAKKRGGLGISSFYALNRALLLKWVWRFISQDGSLWYHIIRVLYGTSIDRHGSSFSSCWSSILREVRVLDDKGFNFFSHCKIHVGNGYQTKFWLDSWISDMALCDRFPRIFALETVKEISAEDCRGDLMVKVRVSWSKIFGEVLDDIYLAAVEV
ncbi:RNA-directed DNA polymerase, eukaryota [Tanacetum coccineum]